MVEHIHPTESTATGSVRTSLLSFFAALPAVGAALLPAITCPACWPAYAGLLSSLGLGFVDYTPWLMPVTILFLAIALTALAWQGYKHHTWGPLVLGSLGAIVLIIGKFQMESDIALYGGAALIITASVWNAWPRKVCPTDIQENDYCNKPDKS